MTFNVNHLTNNWFLQQHDIFKKNTTRKGPTNILSLEGEGGRTGLRRTWSLCPGGHGYGEQTQSDRTLKLKEANLKLSLVQ